MSNFLKDDFESGDKLKTFYLWNLKPGEKKKVPKKLIKKNSKFTKYTDIAPTIIDQEEQYREAIRTIQEEYPPLYEVWNQLQEHPSMSNAWNRLSHWVIKADIIRVLLVYHYGGFYFDCDCSIHQNIEVLHDQQETILFIEDVLDFSDTLYYRECRDEKRRLRIANFAFGSTYPFNHFFKEVLDEIVRRVEILLKEGKLQNSLGQDERQNRGQDILWASGPDVFTSIYFAQEDKSNIRLLSQATFDHRCQGDWRI